MPAFSLKACLGNAKVICICQVAPGFIESDMTAELSDSIIAAAKSSIPAGRFGQPDEVAGLVKYLALDGKFPL